MNRRFDQNLTIFRRRLTSRQLQMIIAWAIVFLLFNTIIYMSFKFLYPSISRLIIPTTTLPPTTTTTTLRSTTKTSFEIGCFYDKTNITFADGSIRPLDLLNIGDEVLVYSSSGQLEKSRVLTIFHHQRSSVRFLDLYTTNNQQPLRLTPSHSILMKKRNLKQSSFYYDFASNVEIGDLLLSSKFKPLRVINIKEILLYNQTISTPLTFQGNIIVNNLIASCYATYHHQFMHLLTIPMRYLYQIETFNQFNHFILHFIDLYSKINF